MKYLHIAILLIVLALVAYNFSNIQTSQIETFATTTCPTPDIVSQSITTNFNTQTNLPCILDVSNLTCKQDTNGNTLDTKLYPIHIIMTPDATFLAVFNDGNIYENDDMINQNLWQLIPNSSPNPNVYLKMITFENTGLLMGVGTDNLLYLKTTTDYTSPWQSTPVPNCGCLVYVMYDKDNILRGLDTSGNSVKQASTDLNSTWTSISSLGNTTSVNNIPLLKMYWDYNGHLLGLGTDFKLYQKTLPTWEVSPWKTKTSSQQLMDIIYDVDARLYGLLIHPKADAYELAKQNQAYYSSPFYPLEDVEAQGVPMLTTLQIVASKMGSSFTPPNTASDPTQDPTLDEIQQQYALESQNKIRQLCASRTNTTAKFYDFELERKIEEQNNLIQGLKTEINKYVNFASNNKKMKLQDELSYFSDIKSVLT